MPMIEDEPTGPDARRWTPSEDLATILSRLPHNGASDDVTRVVEVYESVERAYRAAAQVGTPTINASSTTNR
jgi:hypothetical protein